MSNYPSLSSNHRTDIAIIGAGISGALVAWHLCRAGFDVTVVDKRHVGMGSTAASTALLQYEIDMPLHRLIPLVGEKSAARSYQLCAEAIKKLEEICRRFDNNSGFRFRPSLQVASYKKDVADLTREYRLRKTIGFKLQLWESKEIKNKMGFDADAALYSTLGAEMDAYHLTHQLLDSCRRQDAAVFDNTRVTAIKHLKKGIELKTETGAMIHARHLVIASGYESQQYIPFKVQDLHATYALVSEPMPDITLWHRRCLIWETADPYMYMRTTDDHRILIGGKDDNFYNPDKRDSRIPLKTKQLIKSFSKKFPTIPLKPDFQWSGTFASTKDGLPYIGSIRQRPHTFFALGFGGNGITFSLIAAELITSYLSGQEDADLKIFSFNR
ncbi:NAD(P)/FAD-dependent oxidoreductase [Flavihumibacter solisilvae]|nr:FAD-dependent oxidoreductase [Flavihumibacter solisilvae]